jgi:hypothetical protein
VYSVIPHVVASKVVPDTNTAQVIQNPTVQNAKINKLIDSKLLSKWYQYIFTGENTEVLEFNFELDSFWTIATNAQSTAQMPYDEWTVGPTLAPGTPGYDKIKNPPTPTTSATAVTPSSPIAPDTQQNSPTTIEALVKSINSNDGVAIAQSANPSPGQQTVAAASNAPSAAPLFDNVTYFNQTQQNSSSLKMLNTPAESLPNVNEGAIWPLTVTTSNIPYPIHASQSSSANRTNSVAIGDSPQGRGAFGIIAGNLFSSQIGNFIHMDLGIRGDPYWLGLSNLEQSAFFNSITIPAPTTVQNNNLDYPDGFANLPAGASMFLLTFRTGEEINEDTGFMEFNQTSNGFSGFYVVTQVVNHFKDGQFTQTLSCYKDTFSQGVNVTTPTPATAQASVTTAAASTTPPAPTNTIPANISIAASVATPANVKPNVPTFGSSPIE